MAAPNVGRNTAVGFGKEGTWGTAVSRTKWYRITSTSLDVERTTAEREALHQGVDGSALGEENTGFRASGTLSGQLGYGAIGFILEAALGSVSEDTGSSPKVFTYEGALSLPSLTIEQSHGNTGESRIYEGMKVGKLAIKYDAGSIATWSADFVGETASALSSAGSPSYTDPSPGYIAQGNTAVSAVWNSITATSVQSLEVTVDNQLQTEGSLQSPYIVEPVSQGKKVTCTIQVQYQKAYVAAALLNTQSDLVLTFDPSGSTNELSITLRNATCKAGNPIQGPGIMMQTLTFTGYADGSDSAIQVILKNANSDHET